MIAEWFIRQSPTDGHLDLIYPEKALKYMPDGQVKYYRQRQSGNMQQEVV